MDLLTYEYPKIQNVFAIKEGTRDRIWNNWSDPYFLYLRNCNWICTEKVDGTNVRVIWDGEKVTFAGRTSKAQMPGPLVKRLNELFPVEFFTNSAPMILFGEGYGDGIQSGGYYVDTPKTQDFILFDVRLIYRWMSYTEMSDFAAAKGIQCVPCIAITDLDNAMRITLEGIPAHMGGKMRNHAAEGLVCKPELELLNIFGQRVMVKLKTKTLKECIRL